MMDFYKLFTFFLISFIGTIHNSNAQQVSNKLYQSTLKMLLSHSVPEIDILNAKNKLGKATFLDARKFKEFEVSHIPNAKHIGYKHFDPKKIKQIPKHQEIIVYCSVGYRSEKIAEKLIHLGYTNVSNLYGGLFEWGNNNCTIIRNKKRTDSIHAFNRIWGKWITNSTLIKVYK